MTRYYTGVGSRETPLEVLDLMKQIGYRMAELGYIGRSGAAEGADTAFYEGWGEHKLQSHSHTPFVEYLPWKGFNGKYNVVAPLLENYEQAEEIASKVHPVWERLSRGAKALHARNVYQVLGDDLSTPSNVLFCYAEPTKIGVKGGTNTAVQLAIQNGVKWYNLYLPEHQDEVKRKLKL